MPSQSAPSRIRFGPFELDRSAGELYRDGRRIRLQEHPLQVLIAVLERPGEIVTRDELRERLWKSDTFVDFEHGLNTAVKKARQALGDSADTPAFIETVARRGYRFIGHIESVEAVEEGGAYGPAEPSGSANRAAAPLTRHPVVWSAAILLLAVAVVAVWIGQRPSGAHDPPLTRQTPPSWP